MSLTVCASSTDLDLTTTGNLKSLMGLSATSTGQDVYLGTLIRSASRWAETFIGRPLTAQSYCETLAGYGRLGVMTARTPIRAIDSLYDATDSGGLLTTDIAIDDDEAGLITRFQSSTQLGGFNWSATVEGHSFDAAVPLTLTPMSGQETKPWLLSYRAGWVYAGMTTSSANWSTEKGTTSTGRTLPEDVELAVMLKAKFLYDGAAEAESESIGDLSVNYRSEGIDGSLQVGRAERLLLPYQRYR